MAIPIRKKTARIKIMGLFCGLWVLTVMATLTEGAEINRNTTHQKQAVRVDDDKFKGTWAHSRLAKPPERSGIKVLPGSPNAEKMKKNIAQRTKPVESQTNRSD